MHKIIVRIKGGLGNQLFCYAAARRLAIVNNAELVIDDRTGFRRDTQYRRTYLLDHFHIPARRATPAERLDPFERYRRALMKWSSRPKPFGKRKYIEQEGLDFDERLLSLKVQGTIYLDGLWQSEGYFKDVAAVIREDLKMDTPFDALNRNMAEEIETTPAVALHVRWFDAPGDVENYNLTPDYYQRAISLIEQNIEKPKYLLFSDDPEAAREKLDLPGDRVILVAHNRGDQNAWADLWLMTRCRHFITANSTFSWWGAWLGGDPQKIVVTPRIVQDRIEATNWGFKGLIPDGWLQI